MKVIAARPQLARRRLIQGAAAMVACRALPSMAAPEMPDIPLLAELLAGRTPRWERLRLQLPALADNGLAVPLKLAVAVMSDASLYAAAAEVIVTIAACLDGS